MEQFEQRMLLSISPTSLNELSYLSSSVSLAIQQATDLESYNAADLASTRQWVVGLTGSGLTQTSELARSLGADNLGPTGIIKNTFVWEFSASANWETVAAALDAASTVAYAYPLVPRAIEECFVPNDTLFSQQWHLQNTGQTGGTAGIDANVVPAWNSVTGAGVVIGIVDDAVQYTHPDLTDNYRADLSWDYWEGDADPMPAPGSSDNHGTSVAGVAAAVGNNALGVSGSAPGADFAAIRLTSSWPTDLQTARSLSHMKQEIDIYNNSWGAKFAFPNSWGPLTLAALEQGVAQGRGGLGNVFVFSAGNGREEGHNVNYFDLANSRYTIAVAAIDADGHYASYSTPGASVMVSGHSCTMPVFAVEDGIVTTDRTGEEGYNSTGTFDDDPLPDINYTSTFGGTSSSAPLVSGVIALMLEANPALTYRDVQSILVKTAERNDPGDSDWVVNGAGYHVSHNYGFGAIDANAAVQAAYGWTNVGKEVSSQSSVINIGQQIPDGTAAGLSSSVTLDDTVNSIEWVEVVFDASHNAPSDLEVILTSPDGTQSRLAQATSNSYLFTGSFNQWVFTTCRDWGESAEGIWTLEVRDRLGGSVGAWNSWQLRVYGEHKENTGPGPGPENGVVGPELVAVLPNDGSRITSGDILHVAPRELILQFNERQEIDPATLGAIRIVRAGGDNVLGNANDVTVAYGWIGMGDQANEVVIRFSETLPDDLYQLTIFGAGDVVLKNIQGARFHEGQNLSVTFDLDLGAQVIAVVPQPVTRDPATGALQQSRNTIEVYFNADTLKKESVENPEFYRLSQTSQTATPLDDVAFFPKSVRYDAVKNKVVLTFADDLANLAVGTLRLRIGNAYHRIDTSTTEAELVGDTFGSAKAVGVLGTGVVGESLVISSVIEPLPYDLPWPGSVEEVGHRDSTSVESHFSAGAAAGDFQYGAATYYYNFGDFGSFPNLTRNSSLQKDRVREIFEIYGTLLGVQFIEDTSGANQGFRVGTGDMRAVDPFVQTGVGGVLGIAGGGWAIMDNAETLLWGSSERGGAWFRTAMHEIGHLLGLGHTYDLPAYTVMGEGEQPQFENLANAYYTADSEYVFPGGADLIHGQYLYRPDGTDVDFYKFTVERNGVFSAEAVAERLQNSSLLDSVLSLYDSTGKLIARNDDYSSEDAYIEIDLTPGTYYIAISSTGNTSFDPDVADSGLGGTTQGAYDLRLTFQPKVLDNGVGTTEHLIDATGTLFDGDADGVPGDVYNFWFNSATAADTIFVDKVAAPGGTGTLARPYQEIDQALAAAQAGKIVRIVGNRDRTFLEQRTFTVGADPTGVAVSDFDRDGAMDIVAVNESDDSVSILFGLGDGTYWSQVVRDVGRSPKGIAIGDLNGDGAPDIVVTNQDDRTISILINNGSGGFATQQTRFVGVLPVAVALGDLNADGRLDVVVANQGEDTVGVLLGSATKFLEDQVTYAVGDGPAGLALGDLNNDGTLDVAVANSLAGTVTVLTGRGNGTFLPAGPSSAIAVGVRPVSVAIADFNRDGNRDLVSANYGSDNVSVLLGAGNGTFGSRADLAVGANPSAVAVADLDDDGAVDIVTSDEGNGGVTILFGAGNGTFAADPNVGPYDTGWGPKALVLADMDGDSREDILTANFDDGEVSLVLARRDAPYEIGKSLLEAALPDGWRMEIPKGVTVMIDAGAVLKLREANIDVGSSTEGVDRSLGALQVLGTPDLPVFFSSYHDKSIGEDHAEFDLAPQRGDWGGLVFRNKIDYDVRATSNPNRVILESEGIFLNYVNHAEIRYGGGLVTVNAVKTVYTPIQMIEARPTLSHNTIKYSANAAMSADPNSFAETKFWGDDYTTDFDRVGPDIHGNRLLSNSFNGLFVGINTPAGQAVDKLEVAARWDDLDIVHVISENLSIAGTPGGPTQVAGTDDLRARLDARLTIDPGIFVKLNATRIETEVGAQLIAEGRPGYPVVFTSVFDDRYGAGGTFDTTNNGSNRVAEPGNWGGLYFAPMSVGSLDNALVAYAGGLNRIEGRFGYFDPIEIQQGFVRLTNSTLEFNAGVTDDDRNGRGWVSEAVVFVRGAQPILANNVIRNNLAPAINIDANSLTASYVVDWGRGTGLLAAFEDYPDNYGPLVRDNRLSNNEINGMIVRGAVLTTESVWDDTDIVHVLFDEIVIPNFHTYGGLRLQSRPGESLVVKLQGDTAGFTALGTPQEIDDRIGGTLQILGAAGYPVVLTALADDTVGAGFDPWGASQLDTDNVDATPVAGAWRSVKLERYFNDRNVAIVLEKEAAVGLKADANGEPIQAELIGSLAPHDQAGDDNLRLGFDVRGFIRSDDPTDVDVYSFDGRAGTEVWIDIDRTTMGLDSVVELVDADGNVFARSNDSPSEQADLTAPYGLAATMDRDVQKVGDMYTTNIHDAGMRLVLPGAAGELRTYYVRVRSQGGKSSGAYQLQVRLREDQEIAGSIIQGSSIRYATNGIEVYGAPTHSPLLGETYEVNAVLNDGTLAFLNLGLNAGGIRIDVTNQLPGVQGNGIVVNFVNQGGAADAAAAQYNATSRVLTVRMNVGATTAGTIVNAINAALANLFTATLTANGVVRDWGIVGVLSGGAGGGNDRFQNAEPLGNLLDSDRDQLLVGGYLSGPTDIDWYSFQVDLEHVQGTGAVSWPAIFDIDYGDGMARPDINLYVFDAEGRLIYSSLTSSVDDDQMSPAGAGTDDLSRGSGGTADPLLGPVRLPGGESNNQPVTYYVAITGAGLSSMALFESHKVYTRDEPANSIVRVAEDHVGDSMMSGVARQTVLLPNEDPLRPELTNQATELNIHIDDFSLADVTLFICTGGDLGTFDPFTGTLETDVTGPGVSLPDAVNWGASYGDIAMRDDGRLMSIIASVGLGGNVEPYVGRYREISTGNGSLVSDNDDGLNLFVLNAAGDGIEAAGQNGAGVQFTAFTHVPGDALRWFIGIGHLTAGDPTLMEGVNDLDNFIYVFDADGNPIAPAPVQDQLPTNVLPWGWLDVDGKITGLAYVDGLLYGVTDTGRLYEINFSYAPDIVPFEVPSPADPEKMLPSIMVLGGTTATQIADIAAAGGFQRVSFTGLAAGPPNVEPVGEEMEGAYLHTLFATASVREGGQTTSRLVAFNGAGQLQGVFLDGKATVTLEGNPTTTGLAFSNVDYNLWHITSNRANDRGHGIEIAPDDSRTPPFYREAGNQSYWFGMEANGPQAGVGNYTYGPNANTGALDTYDIPGGAHGTLTTDTFSLAGYSSAEVPTLYFTYFLETDGGTANQVTDSARVFISNDGVTWTMIASNITTISPDSLVTRLQEATHGVGDQKTTEWRQAEISLGAYVGMDNLRIKFEFSTAGSRMVNENFYFNGAYLQARAGIELLDGQTFTVFDKDPNLYPDAQPITFEFDLGYSLVAPNSAGLHIRDGETFTITDAFGLRKVFEFDKDGRLASANNVRVSVSDADSSGDVVSVIRSTVLAAFFDPNAGASSVTPEVTGNRVFLVGATAMTQSANPAMVLEGAPGVDPANVAVPIGANMDDVAVADEIAKAMDARFNDARLTDIDGVYTTVKKNRGLIFVRPNHFVADPGPLPYYGDWQDGDIPVAGGQNGSGTQFIWNLRGQDNRHEGFYVDDVIIGFAERGKMHTDVDVEPFFRPVDPGLAITQGYYQLEIRHASEYGTGVWDTNDRQGDAITIEAPPATEIVHRAKFTVSDGVNSQTFQFLAKVTPGSTEPELPNQKPDEGCIPISFRTGDSRATIAAAIAAAVNSAGPLDVVASTLATFGSNRVELHGAAWVDGIETLVFDNDGQNPTAMEVVDLNPLPDPEAPPLLDTVVVNEYDGTVSVFLDGFNGPTIFDVGRLPSDMAIADFNGDGMLDLAVTNAGDDNVSILLGNGDGTFEEQVLFAVGNQPVAIEAFDLDADGRLDLVVANKAENTISILYGKGNGTFRTQQKLAVGRAPMDVALGDLDGDALGDIVVANSLDNSIWVIRAVMPALYGPAEKYAVGRLPVDIAIGDLDPNVDDPDAPSYLDLVVANRTDGTVSIFMGDGQGGFRKPITQDVGLGPVAVEITDLDPPPPPEEGEEPEIGTPEIVVARSEANTITILQRDMTKMDEYALLAPIDWGVGDGPVAMGFGDVVYADMLIDIVTADYRGHTITVLPCLAPIVYYDLPSSGATGDGYLRDLRGDKNQSRDQGQLIIAGNEILYSKENGITIDAGVKDSWSHPGSPAPLREVNQKRLVPGPVIENNLIVASGEVGILFSGDGSTAGSASAVTFGRIMNNTIYGGAPPLEVEFLEPGTFVLPADADDASIQVPLGFNFDFYGNSFNQIFVNSNGNVTFAAPQFAYTPGGFPAGVPMFAPFWADVDTSTGGQIRAGFGTSVRGNPVFQVDWIDVGYFDNHTDKTNHFTLYIEDDPAGDIVVFKYWDMNWTTADPTGTNGFGGQGAEIGFDAGDGQHYISLMRPKSQDDLNRLVQQGMYVFRMDPDIGAPLLAGGIGIRVTQNASPTLLNNILANLDTGLLIDASSASTVVGSTIYQGNRENTVGTGVGLFAVLLGPNDPLFVDALHGNFYLAKGSQAIDSSVDSLPDRPEMIAVRGPLGIPQSPILAPETDLLGQLRSDDPSADPPPGMGSNVFKDRGAIDRVDFYVPMARLTDPLDNDAGGVDRDPAEGDVFVSGKRLDRFTIELVDLIGAGIDDYSVTSDKVKVYLDSSAQPLVPDVDYYFRYDTIRNVITLVPASGFWKEAATYTIVLDRSASGIRDAAANPLRANRLDNTTKFVIAISEFDFGDAVDPPHASLLASDGARHLLIGGYYLGASVTGEKDANLAKDRQGNLLPDSASGDAGDDGVALPSVLLIDSLASIAVTASKSGGVLDAWADFNLDGDWDDPGEQIFDNKSLRRGKNNLTFVVPAGLEPGRTFLRFRYSRDGVATPYGEAPTGEVEDYRIDLVSALVDYGDAPAPYPTFRDDDGAAHAIGSGRFLGSAVDEEIDGQPDPNALGDDLSGPTGSGGSVVNDEDGVQFLGALLPGKTTEIIVTTSMAGYLNAWIDFNGDGVWSTEGADGEAVFAGLSLDRAGEHHLFVSVPADAVEGFTFARFRFSGQEVLEPTGYASDGEVEDYQVLVVSTPSDYGDAPRTYGTVAASEPATAVLRLSGADNDLFLTAVTSGTTFNGVGIVFINLNAKGNEALVSYNSVARNLVIDVDPAATTAKTVLEAINAQGLFTARLDYGSDLGNDGSGLIKTTGKVATTANGHDGFGAAACRHVVSKDLLLGKIVDVEMDGRPDAKALGDDNHGLDDEDGVTPPAQIVAGLVARFNVEVTMGGEMTQAYLNAWIDLNQDGVWTEDERVIAARPVVNGVQEVQAIIPATALAGDTFARFRLSSAPTLTPLGEAPDGEVEDYQFRITKGDAKISGWKFDDRDNDGVKDSTEPGVPGVRVYLDINGNGQLDVDAQGVPVEPATVTWYDDYATVGTNEAGYYEFAGLLGQLTPYVVREIPIEGWSPTYPTRTSVLPDGSFGKDDHSWNVLLGESEHVANVNFGNYRKPTVAVKDVTVVEGNDGYTYFQVTLSLTESFGAPVSIQYSTQDGTATSALPNRDYIAANGTVNFGAQNPPEPTWTTKVLTSNSSNDYDYEVSGKFIVWEGWDGHDTEIYLYNGATSSITQVTDNDVDDAFAAVYDTGANPYVVWTSNDGADTEVWFYDGTSARVLTTNDYDDWDPQVSASHVTWWARSGADSEIYVWKIGDPIDGLFNLSDNNVDDFSPRISGSNIVWSGYRNAVGAPEDLEVFVYDGTENLDGTPHVIRVTSNSRMDSHPQIDGNLIVWEGRVGTKSEIFLYNLNTGATTQVTNNSQDDLYPQISGSDVVWQGYDGSDWEIFHYNAEAQTAPQNLSQNSTLDEQPQVKNGRVVWHGLVSGNWEVFTRQLRSTTAAVNISNNTQYDWYPQVSDSLVIWRTYDGEDYEIVVATSNVPEVTRTITLRVVGDTNVESDEHFFVNFTPPSSVIMDVTQAKVRILNDDGALDFGDAPDPTFATLLANDGARHLIVSGWKLGATVDAEKNGQPTAAANGDDLLTSDDEDGVQFNSILGRGATAQVTVTASAAGYLDAWFDFNRDGDWDDAGERVFDHQAVAAGDNTLNFPIPPNASVGQTYARFRYSSTGVSSYTGQAQDGEVEDYRVEIVPNPPITMGTVGLSGTDADDTFEFWAKSAELLVSINGATYHFPRPEVNKITFNGRGGSDTVIFHGSDGADTVEMWPDRATMTGAGSAFTVLTSNVELINAFDGGDGDRAIMHDSSQTDLFDGGPTASVLSALGYRLTAEYFPTVEVYSTLGGNDRAMLRGSGADDLLIASPGRGEIGVRDPNSGEIDPAGYRIVAEGFRYVHGDGSGTGMDWARLTGSTGDDTFTGSPTSSTLAGGAYELKADAFETVKAYAVSGGVDRANLYGSAGNDSFESRPAGDGPSYAKLSSRDQVSYDLYAQGFRYNTASAGTGNDTATMFASSGDDLFEGHPTYAKLSGVDFYHRVDSFDTVTAWGSPNAQGNVARFYDSAGNDTFTVGPNEAVMRDGSDRSYTYKLTAKYFRYVTGYAQAGGDDLATLTGTPGSDTYVGTPVFGQLSGEIGGLAYAYRAYAFDNVEVKAHADAATPTPGKIDTATLYDSALVDLLEAQAPAGKKHWARLSDYDGLLGYAHMVEDFDKVTARSSSVGDKKRVTAEAALLGFLSLEGNWTDDL